MRACRLVAFFCAVVLVSIMAAPARSATDTFTDDFAGPRPGRWTPGAHPLGRSTLDPANVAVAGGRLALALPRGNGATRGASRAARPYGGFRPVVAVGMTGPPTRSGVC